MQWEALLAEPAWQEIQILWKTLPSWPPSQTEQAYSDYIQSHWKTLRLCLESSLLALQPLVLKQLISPQSLEAARTLLHMRLDRRLGDNQTKIESPYQLQKDPYLRPVYSCYHALQELEQRIKILKTEAYFEPYLSENTIQTILGDLNLDLLEKYAQLIGKEARQKYWPLILDTLIALELKQINTIAGLAYLQERCENEDPLSLAANTLLRSRFTGALRTALSLLNEAEGLSNSLLPALNRLLTAPGQHSLRASAVKLLKQFALETAWESILPLLKETHSDSFQAEGSFGQVRLAALELLSNFTTLPQGNEMIALMQAGIYTPSWGNLTRLKAIQILAQWGIQGYLEEVLAILKTALAHDHLEEFEAALEVLKKLKDQRCVPILLEQLRKLSDSDTALESFRQAFQGDRKPIEESIINTIKTLGQTVVFDRVSQNWILKS
jgi:HEAT repeat protein